MARPGMPHTEPTPYRTKETLLIPRKLDFSDSSVSYNSFKLHQRYVRLSLGLKIWSMRTNLEPKIVSGNPSV